MYSGFDFIKMFVIAIKQYFFVFLVISTNVSACSDYTTYASLVEGFYSSRDFITNYRTLRRVIILLSSFSFQEFLVSLILSTVVAIKYFTGTFVYIKIFFKQSYKFSKVLGSILLVFKIFVNIMFKE